MDRIDRMTERVAKRVRADGEQVEGVGQYVDLNDVYFVTNDNSFLRGTTEIWYMTNQFARDGMMGYDWLTGKGILPDAQRLSKTHRFIGAIRETNLDKIFGIMQGEYWSPKGQARNLIRRAGVGHTSMSVGDIVVHGGKAYIVDSIGFKELK